MRMYKKSGFTLIELLVVIAIIAILAAILFPIFARARDAGYKARCVANMKQVGLAFQQYLEDSNGRYPAVDNWCRVYEALGYGTVSPNKRFIIDRLMPYCKNGNIWLCPTLKPDGTIPDYPRRNESDNFKELNWSTAPNANKWKFNCGNEPRWLYNSPSNLWFIWAYSPPSVSPGIIYTSGKTTSELVISASKAMVILELPYWANSPHILGNGKQFGMNALYFDGHVKLLVSVSYCTMWDYGWNGYNPNLSPSK